MKTVLTFAFAFILSTVISAQTIEQAFVDRLNDLRKDLSLSTFTRASEFDSAAKVQSNWLVKTAKLSHVQTVQLPGTKLLAYPWDRGKEYGAEVLSENLILAVQHKRNSSIDPVEVAKEIFEVWYNSEPHLLNMLADFGNNVVPAIGIALTEFPETNSCSVVAVFGVKRPVTSAQPALLVNKL